MYVFRWTLVAVLVVGALGGCGDRTVLVPSPGCNGGCPVDNVVHAVTVTPGSINIAIGGSTTLSASVDAGAGVTNRTVTWSSADTTIATVDAAGKLTAVKFGSTVVKAASNADKNVFGSAGVTVGGAI